MRSPEEIQRLAQKFWVDEAFSDEAVFRSYKHILQTELHKLCQAWDLDGLADWLAVYHYAEPRCREEPLLTAYEHGLLLTTLSIAGTHAAMRSFDTAYSLIAQVQGLLQTGDVRRERLGLPERPNSEARYHAYAILAELKWQGSENDLERLLIVDEVAGGFRKAADRALSWLAANPDHDPSRVTEALALLGVDIATMLYRRYRDQRSDMITEFLTWYNSRCGNHLACMVGHYQTHDPLADSPYYWSFEIAKLHFAGLLSHERLEYCHARRMNTVLDSLNEPRRLIGLYGCWDRQNRWMLATIGITP